MNNVGQNKENAGFLHDAIGIDEKDDSIKKNVQTRNEHFKKIWVRVTTQGIVPLQDFELDSKEQMQLFLDEFKKDSTKSEVSKKQFQCLDIIQCEKKKARNIEVTSIELSIKEVAENSKALIVSFTDQILKELSASVPGFNGKVEAVSDRYLSK